MITLPTQLANFMKGKDLAGLKPFALLYRNKWDSVNNKFALEDTPIDISALIAKPNTLSMTLDVNEVAQYNANNVTLTLEDTKNYFVEGTPNSYFPEWYQVYGSKVVLYYGLNTPINPYPTQVGYTVVGSPTITDGVATGFNSNSYLISSSNLAQQAEIECYVRVKIGQSVVTHNVFFGFTGGDYPIRYSPSYKFSFYKKNAGGWTEGITQYAVGNIVDVKYIYKDGYLRLYTKLASADLWTQEMQLAVRSNPIYGTFYFGRNATASNQYISGSIDLNHTYIKVNGEYWFNGAHFFWKNNSTPLFTGVIKELPAHKPDKYQVDLKLVSPLEMLKDIEAKDFSDKVTGEVLTYKETDTDGHRIYWTTGTGVGGFNAVYADGAKLFEGVDYETGQLNALGLPAIVTIINSDLYSATITADYYTWKTGLTVEQIVTGLVGLAGYDTGTEDIRNVIWQTSVRTSVAPTSLFTLGYTPNNSNGFDFTGGGNAFWGSNVPPNTVIKATSIFPTNFVYELAIGIASYSRTAVSFGELEKNNYNAFYFSCSYHGTVDVTLIRNGDILNPTTFTIATATDQKVIITKQGNTFSFSSNYEYIPGVQYTVTLNMDLNYGGANLAVGNRDQRDYLPALLSQKLTDTDTGIVLDKCGIAYQVTQSVETSWVSIEADKSTDDAPTAIQHRTSDNGTDFTAWNTTDLGSDLGVSSKIIQFVLTSTNAGNAADFSNVVVYYLGSTLTLQLANLSGLTVLEALQDFALISGYEFGVDRQGVFFFRPRLSSTTPVYVLDHSELVKVDSVKKNLSDFFTKLTLTFAQVPLEFYANDGPRPNSIDKYGVINKEIDKPDIVNYDNPELAQAIGPQLLEVYSALPNVIQATGKLNLALELADIVSLRRNYNLIADPEGSDFNKYRRQQTYYRACKITGMNYNFAKKQITYTLRDVSNSNNMPPINAYGFVYDLPIQLGKLKTE